MRLPLGQRLKYTAGRYLPFLKIAPPANREAVFRLRPIRNGAIEWDVSPEGEALLKIPRRNDRMARFMAAWLHVPDTRGVQLDEVGTYVWGLCDGEHTVEGIVRETCKEYKMNRREVEISVTTYLQMLAERNFIGLYQRESGRAGRKGGKAK